MSNTARSATQAAALEHLVIGEKTRVVYQGFTGATVSGIGVVAPSGVARTDRVPGDQQCQRSHSPRHTHRRRRIEE